MTLDEKIAALDPQMAKQALSAFLTQFMAPAFGSLPKREIELAVFALMRDLDLISEQASLFDLMTELRITRSKATQLLFDRDVRGMGRDQSRLDAAIQTAVLQSRFARDGDYFVLEIENPLVLAHLKQRLRALRHLSDSSFNAALVRMTADAASDLISALIADDQKRTVQKALIAAGAPDTSLKGVLKSSIKKLGSKVLGDVSDGLIDDASNYLGPLFDGAAEAITSQWKQLFSDS